jgi:hypothetical protein
VTARQIMPVTPPVLPCRSNSDQGEGQCKLLLRLAFGNAR